MARSAEHLRATRSFDAGSGAPSVPCNGSDLRAACRAAQASPISPGPAQAPQSPAQAPLSSMQNETRQTPLNGRTADGRTSNQADFTPAPWSGILAPGGLTIFCGAGQAGVTALAVDIAARVSPGKALYLADAPTLKRLDARLTAAGALCESVPRLPLDQADNFSLDYEAVEAALAGMPGGASLLVLDALRVGLARDGDLNQNSRLMFESLAAAAERQGIAVLACVRLPGRRNPSERALGALASCAAALTTFAVVRDDLLQERRLLVPLRGIDDCAEWVFRVSRAPQSAAPRVEWWVDGSESADGAGPSNAGPSNAGELGGAESDDGADRPTAGEWLRGKLATGPREVDELRREAIGDGYSWSTICRAKRRLKLRSWKLVKDHRELYKWRLPREARGERRDRASRIGQSSARP